MTPGTAPPKSITTTGYGTGEQQQQAFVDKEARTAPPKGVKALLILLNAKFRISSAVANAVRIPKDAKSRTLPTEK